MAEVILSGNIDNSKKTIIVIVVPILAIIGIIVPFYFYHHNSEEILIIDDGRNEYINDNSYIIKDDSDIEKGRENCNVNGQQLSFNLDGEAVYLDGKVSCFDCIKHNVLIAGNMILMVNLVWQYGFGYFFWFKW